MDNQTREMYGAAIAGWVLAMGILKNLADRNLLTPSDHDLIVEQTLGNLERFQDASNPGVQRARELVDLIQRRLAQGR